MEIFILIAIILGINWVLLKLYFEPKKIPDKQKYIIQWIVAICIIGAFWFYQDANTIKNGKYYVNLFRENSKSKNYRVPADIEIIDGEIYIMKAYFPNGGYITFDDSFGIEPLEVGEKTYTSDDHGEYWYVELTKDKVK